MAALTGNLISDSYSGLLKTTDNGTITSTTKNITDGAGNATPLSLSTSRGAINGTFAVSGSTILSGSTIVLGSLTATASFATTASYSISSSYAVSSSNAVTSSYSIQTTTAATASLATNAITLNSTASAIFAITGSNTFNGTQVVSGSLRMHQSASFVLPTYEPTSPVIGTMFFSGSFIYVYNGTSFKSASLS
jgi:hypothetical protein